MVVCWLAPLSVAETADAVTDGLPDYSSSTHNELTALGARWDELADAERRALLREVKLRMAQRKDSDGVLMIRTQRRYGRIYRHSDGRVLRIETQVVQVRPAAPGEGRTGFGVGYERRSAEGPGAGSVSESAGTPEPDRLQPQEITPPAILVNDPDRR